MSVPCVAVDVWIYLSRVPNQTSDIITSSAWLDQFRVAKNNTLAKQLRESWLKLLALHIPTRQVCLLSEVQEPSSPNTTASWWRGCSLMHPHPLFFEGCPKKKNTLRDLEDTYWNTFCRCKVFFLKHNLSERAWCIWRALWGAVWHSGTNESLCCLVGSYIILQTPAPEVTAGGFAGRSLWYTWPYTELIRFFTFLTEAAVNSIATSYCSYAKFFQVLSGFLAKAWPPHPVSASEPCCFGSGAAGSWASQAGRSMASVLLRGSTASAAAAAAPSHPACLSSAFPAITHSC